MSKLENLQVHPARLLHQVEGEPRTGVYVRAKYQDRWGNYDIAELDDESLAAFVNLRLDDAGKLRLIHILLGRG